MLMLAAGSVPLPVRLPTVLAASGTTEPARTVNRPLEANIAVLQFGDRSSVIVTMDLLFIGRALRSGVEQRLASMISPDQLIMAASHTHYAPPTDLDKPLLGEADPAWVDALANLVADEVHRLLSREPAAIEVSHGVGSTGVAINRRRRRLAALSRRGLAWRPVMLAPNPSGYVERGIHVIEFREGGALRAVLWSMACHPVSLHSRTAVDSHYIGHVRSKIRQRGGDNELPVLFLQGFAGDCRPMVKGRVSSMRQAVGRIARGPSFGSFPNQMSEADWLQAVDAGVLGLKPRPIHVDRLVAARTLIPRSEFVRSTSKEPASFSGLRLGPLRIVGGSAEFVGKYRDLIDPDGDSQRLTCGYLDDVFGYAATSSMLRDGGYEVDGFCPYFGVDKVSPSIEASVLEGFLRVERRIG